MKFKALSICALSAGMLMLAGACKNSNKAEAGDSVAVAETETTEVIEQTGDSAAAPAQQADSNAPDFSKYDAKFFADSNKANYQTTPSGLKYVVTKKAEGKKPKATDTVKVNYAGYLTNGTEFDSSYQRGEPTEFPLNGVIPGWTEGIQLMNTGETAVFYIPSNLAYGERGFPGAIPPNSDLIFGVELLDIMPSGN